MGVVSMNGFEIPNNKDINQHIHANERDKWNDTRRLLDEHLNHSQPSGHTANQFHVPPLPSTDQQNWYLGGDLHWHQVPRATLSV